MYVPHTIKATTVYSTDDLKQDIALARLEGCDKAEHSAGWSRNKVEKFVRNRRKVKTVRMSELTSEEAAQVAPLAYDDRHDFEGEVGEVADLLLAGKTPAAIAHHLRITKEKVGLHMDTIRDHLVA